MIRPVTVRDVSMWMPIEGVLAVAFVILMMRFPREGRTQRQRVVIAVVSSLLMASSLGMIGYLIATGPN